MLILRIIPITEILDINHLRFLVNETWDARTKWEAIGCQLGIDKSTLTSIDISKRGNADTCYSEMLSIWLRRDGATWKTLLEVLESRPVNFPDVATAVKALSDEKKEKIGYI